ncbi:hypothetical protein A0128_06870 [Leptospira tipperaryensis]|uniref:Uncharacterized protein n=1 Tax=Leptospira tipperaryensis TaxID=2564040 RepID=A0A1D7UVM7_9LEPT|nr:hypothetical protein A0128_06870 [Leptospira tipperaryensis]
MGSFWTNGSTPVFVLKSKRKPCTAKFSTQANTPKFLKESESFQLIKTVSDPKNNSVPLFLKFGRIKIKGSDAKSSVMRNLEKRLL